MVGGLEARGASAPLGPSSTPPMPLQSPVLAEGLVDFGNGARPRTAGGWSDLQQCRGSVWEGWVN